MGLTITFDTPRVERISRNLGMMSGIVAFDASYPTGGESVADISKYFKSMKSLIFETDSGYLFAWDGTNDKVLTYLPSGTPVLSGEAAHTHAVALDTGASGAEAAHTHAVTLDSGTSAAGSAHVHTNTPGYHATVEGVTVGTPALTHNADPPTNLNANALYIVEAYGVGNKNIGVLQSNCDGTTSILGSADDVSGAPGAATPRFFVTHAGSPGGVQVYVNESDNDKLSFVSPTATDAVIIMPFEAIAGGVPGYAYAVTVHHDASAGSYKPLYFDDNGAADAQLCFNDTGTAGGVIYANDITVIGPQYTAITGNSGAASSENAHTHGPGTLADAASAAGSSHTHASGTLADATSGTGSSHTHTATGEAADEVGNAVDLSALTDVKFVATGLI